MLSSTMDSQPQLFPALLRYWRNARGLSQLDLSGAADVSSKHISFLETARARPSREMVLRLGATLDIPLREQNTLLTAAGYAPNFHENPASGFEPSIQRALEIMMLHHNPYPLLAFDRRYDIVLANTAIKNLLATLLGAKAESELNVMKLLFDPRLLRPHVVDWESTARMMLQRLQRETLHRRNDAELNQLITQLCQYEDIPSSWRIPDFEQPTDASATLRLEFGGQQLAFLATVTVFERTQDVALEELRIESYYPLDDKTEAFCRAMGTQADSSAT